MASISIRAGLTRLDWNIDESKAVELVQSLLGTLPQTPTEISEITPFVGARVRYDDGVGVVRAVDLADGTIRISWFLDQRDDTPISELLAANRISGWQDPHGYRFDHFPPGSHMIEALLHVDRDDTFESCANMFQSDISYNGDEVIGRIRDMQHLLDRNHPLQSEGCIICKNNPEGI